MNIYTPTSRIYQAINKITNERYIGFTVQKVNQRTSNHFNKANNKNSKEYGFKFYRAIRKYGMDNFEWVILYESWDDEYCLKVVEDLLIVEYDTINNGYNMVPGGSKPPSNTGKCGPLHPRFGKPSWNKGLKTNKPAWNNGLKMNKPAWNFGKKIGPNLKARKPRNKEFKQRCLGKNNPAYDHNIYTFLNIITTEKHIGTRAELKEKYSEIDTSALKYLIQGEQKQHKGWIFINY